MPNALTNNGGIAKLKNVQFTASDNTLTNGTDGTMSLTSVAITDSANPLTNFGTMTLNGVTTNYTTEAKGVVTNNGLMNFEGTNTIANDITGSGTLDIDNNLSESSTTTLFGNIDQEQILVEERATLNLTGANQTVSATTLTNFGNLKLTGSTIINGIVLNDNAIEISGSATVENLTAHNELSTTQLNGNATLTVTGSAMQGEILLADGATLVNEGALASKLAKLNGEFGTLKNNGIWYPLFEDGKSSNDVNVALSANGIINLSDADWDREARPFRTLEINGSNFTADGGAFIINTDLAVDDGDKIKLNHETVTGTANVAVAYDPTAVLGKNVKGSHTFITLENNQKITVTGVPYRYVKGGAAVTILPTVVNKDGGTDASDEWKIIALTTIFGASETTKAIADSATLLGMAWLQNTNNMQKRLGDLRGGEASNTGWARFERSNDTLNNGRSLGISANLFQVGYDFLVASDKTATSYFGLSLEHLDGSGSFKIGSSDIKSTTISAYYTKIFESGHYFDIIARYGKLDSDTKMYDADMVRAEFTELDYSMNAFTLSGEYGYRAKLGKSGFYIEPQAEIIYGYLSGAKKTSSQNIEADIDSTRHFITRAGIAFGQKVKNFNHYLRASYYHDFAGSTAVTYGDGTYKQDGAKNWWEVSLGGGWQMGDASYFYAELTKHFKDISNSVNFNLGFRFTL